MRPHLGRLYTGIYDPMPFLAALPTLGFEPFEDPIDLDGRPFHLASLTFGSRPPGAPPTTRGATPSTWSSTASARSWERPLDESRRSVASATGSADTHHSEREDDSKRVHEADVERRGHSGLGHAPGPLRPHARPVPGGVAVGCRPAAGRPGPRRGVRRRRADPGGRRIDRTRRWRRRRRHRRATPRPGPPRQVRRRPSNWWTRRSTSSRAVRSTPFSAGSA